MQDHLYRLLTEDDEGVNNMPVTTLRTRLLSRRPIAAVVVAAAVGMAGMLATGNLRAKADQASTDRPSVSLGEGRVGPYRWAVEVFPGGKRSEPGSLCLSTALREPTEGSVFESCGPLGPGLVDTERAGTRSKPMEVVTFLLPGTFKRLYLKLAGQPGRTFPLKQFSAEDLTSISEVPLSSFAHGYGRRVCLQRYIAYNEAGNAALAGREPCAHSRSR